MIRQFIPRLRISLLALACMLPLASYAQYDLIGVYLNWQRDPTTTMTVNWVNLYPDQPATVSYRPLGETAWQTADGKAHAAEPSVLQVRHVELTGLKPDTMYEFVLGIPPKPKPLIPEKVTSALTPATPTAAEKTPLITVPPEDAEKPIPLIKPQAKSTAKTTPLITVPAKPASRTSAQPSSPAKTTPLITSEAKKKEEEVDDADKPIVKTPRDTRSLYRFRTMPAELTRPVRFVSGGDMMHSREMVDAMNKVAGALDPDFALLGGDLAYENGSDVTRYIDWFQSWTKNARGKGGRLIPMVLAIGNHEVRGGYKGDIPEDAPYFYGFFPLPESRSYYALDFGKYLSVLALDTGHTQPITGAQTTWLGQAMAARAEQRYVFPVYHWPIYGTTKASKGQLPCESKRSVEMREQWVPHFERFGVTAIFENDHHNYKRTYPIRGHKRDEKNGIVYLGDGAWGVNTRDVPKDAWYLAKAEPRRHLHHITLPVSGPVLATAVDAKGVIFDKTSFTRPRTLPIP